MVKHEVGAQQLEQVWGIISKESSRAKMSKKPLRRWLTMSRLTICL